MEKEVKLLMNKAANTDSRKGECAQYMQEIKLLKNKLAASEDKLQDIMVEFAESKRTLYLQKEAADNEMEKLDAQTASLQKENHQKEEKLKVMQSQLENMSNEFNRMKQSSDADIDMLHELNDAHVYEVDTLTAEVTTLKEQLVEERSKSEADKKRMKKSDGHVAMLKEKLQSSEASIALMKETKEEVMKNLSKVKEELDEEKSARAADAEELRKE
eukprot:6056616-Ditylum_brightwellii.AAC.1